jgi:hypothetical protein
MSCPWAAAAILEASVTARSAASNTRFSSGSIPPKRNLGRENDFWEEARRFRLDSDAISTRGERLNQLRMVLSIIFKKGPAVRERWQSASAILPVGAAKSKPGNALKAPIASFYEERPFCHSLETMDKMGAFEQDASWPRRSQLDRAKTATTHAPIDQSTLALKRCFEASKEPASLCGELPRNGSLPPGNRHRWRGTMPIAADVERPIFEVRDEPRKLLDRLFVNSPSLFGRR